MKLGLIEDYLQSVFRTKNNKLFTEESGFTYRGKEDIRKIGYCTNLNLGTVNEAVLKKVDLVITHHDAWDFVYGLKEKCLQKLNSYGISHYFSHLPLDDAVFGTNVSLLKKLGLKLLQESHEYEGFYCGRIGVYESPLEYSIFVHKVERLLNEPVKWWRNNDREVTKVGIVTGGGNMTSDVKEAFDLGCDVYLTGEKVLYTIEYAKYAGINLIVGSHTHTEIFGVESLAQKVQERFNGLEIIRLKENHFE